MNTYKINTKSWHYSLVDGLLGDTRDRRDFCSYWRGVVISCILVTAIAVLVGMAFTIMVAMPLYTFYQIYFIGHGYDLFFVVLAWVLWSICGLGYIASKHKERRIQAYQAWEKIGHPEPKQPGLLTTWYRAYKGKYCPMVEFVDE